MGGSEVAPVPLSLVENRVGVLPATAAVKSRSTDRRIDVAIDAETPVGLPKEMWLWIREAGKKAQLGRPSFFKTSLYLLPLLALMPVQTWGNAQVRGYAELICGANLKTAEKEDPEIKKRCMSGLMRLGKKALRVSGSSIQRCKLKPTFSAA